MPIISLRDNENNRWKRNAKKAKKQKANKDRKEQQECRSYSERVRAKWFSCAFKFCFLQLIYKDSLIFKSNLELAWSLF